MTEAMKQYFTTIVKYNDGLITWDECRNHMVLISVEFNRDDVDAITKMLHERGILREFNY